MNTITKILLAAMLGIEAIPDFVVGQKIDQLRGSEGNGTHLMLRLFGIFVLRINRHFSEYDVRTLVLAH